MYFREIDGREFADVREMVSLVSCLTLCDVVCLCRTQLTYSPAIGMLASTLGMTPCLTLEVRDSGRFSDTVIGRVTIPVAPLLSCPMDGVGATGVLPRRRYRRRDDCGCA